MSEWAEFLSSMDYAEKTVIETARKLREDDSISLYAVVGAMLIRGVIEPAVNLEPDDQIILRDELRSYLAELDLMIAKQTN